MEHVAVTQAHAERHRVPEPSQQPEQSGGRHLVLLQRESINRILGKELSFVPAVPALPQRVFTFNTNPPTWSFDNRDKPPSKPVSPDSTTVSSF
jgi:hypothetical protein